MRAFKLLFGLLDEEQIKIPNIDRIYRYHLLLTVAEFFCLVQECSHLQHFGCAGGKVSFFPSPAASMEGEMYGWGISGSPKHLLCCGFVPFGGGCFLKHPTAKFRHWW